MKQNEIWAQMQALQLLLKMGYVYLSPEQIHQETQAKPGNLLLENILKQQIRQINATTTAVDDLTVNDELTFRVDVAIENLKASIDTMAKDLQRFNQLLTQGSLQKYTLGGGTRSVVMKYIDFNKINSNVFHVSIFFLGKIEAQPQDFTNGFANDTQICLVLYVNGIPFCVIDTQSANTANPNQKIKQIRSIAQWIIRLDGYSAQYTMGGLGNDLIPNAFWREPKSSDPLILDIYQTKLDHQIESSYQNIFEILANLDEPYLSSLDRTIFGICKPERLLELFEKFKINNQDAKFIIRSEQYFIVKSVLNHLPQKGGIIYQPQGSGKSITMLLLAKQIINQGKMATDYQAYHKIILVVDRQSVDDQYALFKSAHLDIMLINAGKKLLDLLKGPEKQIFLISAQKFEIALNYPQSMHDASQVLIMFDQQKNIPYDQMHKRIQQRLFNACHLEFTNIPLTVKGDSPSSLIASRLEQQDLIKDLPLMPAMYEKRSADAQSLEIASHYETYWQDTGVQAQVLVKTAQDALRFKKEFDAYTKINTAVVLVSQKDMDDTSQEPEISIVQTQDHEDESSINLSKLVVSDISILYICRKMEAYELFQIIAKMMQTSRQAGKQISRQASRQNAQIYILDYENDFDFDFEDVDIKSIIKDVRVQNKKLAQLHYALCRIFEQLDDQRDMQSLAMFLRDEDLRKGFYQRWTDFAKALRLALSTQSFLAEINATLLAKYLDDFKRFFKLQIDLSLRYAEIDQILTIDPSIKKIVNKYLQDQDLSQLIQQTQSLSVDQLKKLILEKTQILNHVESKAAIADRIAHAMIKYILPQYQVDLKLVKDLSIQLQAAIHAFHQHESSEDEFLSIVSQIKDTFMHQKSDEALINLMHDDRAKLFYHPLFKYLIAQSQQREDFRYTQAEIQKVASQIALKMSSLFSNLPKRFWRDDEAKKQIINAIDDFFYDEIIKKYQVLLSGTDMDHLIQTSMQIAEFHFN